MACSLIVVIVRARKAVHAPARMGDRQFVARSRVGCGRNVGVARCELARAAGDRHRIARAVSQKHPDAGRLKHGAAVAGAEGKVVATDLSPEMLAYGRERTAAAGLGNVEFVESEAASLNFPPESFDAALSRFGIIFEPEAEAAAARVRGFLVPGSRMVISSWGPPGRVPFIAVPMGTAMRTLGVDPPPPGTPGPLSRPTPEALGGLLEGGGFSDVEVEETEVSFKWESADEFVAMVKDTVPPLVALIAKHAPDDPDRAWDAILGAVKETASDDGTVTFSNLVLLAVGRA